MDESPLEAKLGTVTDEEWLTAHRALIGTGVIPREELHFLYDPGRDSDSVTKDDLTEDGQPHG